MHVGDAPQENTRSYEVVTNSFLATGGDHYQTFTNVKPQKDLGVLVSDVLEEYVRLKRTLDAPQGGRMTAAQ